MHHQQASACRSKEEGQHGAGLQLQLRRLQDQLHQSSPVQSMHIQGLQLHLPPPQACPPPVCTTARATCSWQTCGSMVWVCLGLSELRCSGWCVTGGQSGSLSLAHV
jgi:hypothetical protein